MSPTQPNANVIVKRLRWVMLGVMFFSVINTLAGQPSNFWLQPEHAIRFDGHSIYSTTNPQFEFLLGHGWEPYVLACALYLSATFFFVSILPNRVALISTFSVIFGHYYGGANWLVVRWRLGMAGAIMYALVLAVCVTMVAVPEPERARTTLKGLRRLAVAALLLDFACTLIGQPHSYWHYPISAHEANALSRMFLVHGWYAYALYDGVYCLLIWWMASALPLTAALISMFAFLLGGFAGVSNWLFYEWRMGIEAPVMLGILVSAGIVMLAFPESVDRTAEITGEKISFQSKAPADQEQ